MTSYVGKNSQTHDIIYCMETENISIMVCVFAMLSKWLKIINPITWTWMKELELWWNGRWKTPPKNQSSCKLWKMLRLTDFDQLEKLTKRSALATSCAYFFNNSSNSVTSSDWVGKCGHFQIAAPFQRAHCTDQTDTAADKSRRANIQEKFFGSGSRLLLVLKILYEKK